MPIAARRDTSLARLLPLLLAAPLFLQSFHYIVDVYPLYLLSKGWPLLTLPLALLGLAEEPRHRPLLLAVIAYVLLVPPVMTMVHFHQSYTSAATGMVKVLPFTCYFSVLWLLRRLRPSAADLHRCFFWLGAANLGLLALLWVVVPESAYRSGAIGEEVSKLFLWDPERGNRITLPLVFGLIFIFLQARHALRGGGWWRMVLALGAVALLVLTYKQRTVIGCIVMLLGYLVMAEATPRARLLLGWLAGVALAAGLAWVLLDGLPFNADGLGGSLSARELTISLALNFLAENPLRWVFGAGALTRASDITFPEYFNHPNFYLVDIGWLGIIFEYGLIGAGLLLAVYVVALRAGGQTPHAPDAPLVPALCDYARFLLLSSPVLSVVWAPGEVCSLLAVFTYLHRPARGADAR